MNAVLLLAASAAALTGGPDSFGYTFTDSTEPDGPAYAWTDISGTGTNLGLTDDSEASIELPFTFFFYGGAYDLVTVGDGALLFGYGASIDNGNGCVPADNSAGDDALVLPFWDDLNTEENPEGGVYWEILGSAPARSLVIQYERVPHYGGSTLFSFQAILEEGSNAVLLQYATVQGSDPYAGGSSATVGIQASDELGLGYSCASAVLIDELAIRFDALCEDLDGDGAGSCDGDCDDGDPGTGPTASELDDGLDNDCDGLVDEDFVAYGDVVINELMPDTQAIDDQQGEWFELHNTSARSVDLFGWAISDSATSLTIDQHVVLAPGGYGLFAAGAEGNGNLPAVDWVFDWDSLHLVNAGDVLGLRMGGLLMDQVDYRAQGWVVTPGTSLFLDAAYADPDANDSPLPWCTTPASAPYDYGGAGVGDYGTPGGANPAGLCCRDEDGDGSDVCDGDCDDDDPGRFPGNPELQDLVDNDCDGVADEDWLLAGDLVISEFMDEPSAVEQGLGEWFELVNVSPQAVNLEGWRFTDEAGEGFTVEGALVVEAGGRSLFAVEGDAALNGGLPEVDYVYPYELFPLRSYDDDDIQLIAGELSMDAVSYRNVDPWDSQPGSSHYLCPDAVDAERNDEVGWWGTTPADGSYSYGDGDHGTPGDDNPGDVDADGDGVLRCDGDCDDADPAVGPGTAEDCANGLDDDCDGLVDGDDEDCAPGDSGEPMDSAEPNFDDTGAVEPDEGCGGCSAAGVLSRGAAVLSILLGVVVGLRRRR
jgi:hypothetical protein